MSSAGGGGGGGGGGGVGGALSLMGCVREASPPPQEPLSLGELSAQPNVDALSKEPKKRRFHPLRGLRKIFRRKSRGAADARLASGTAEGCDLPSRDREEVTLRHPAGRPEEARSRSASELLTDSCDRESRRPLDWPRKYRLATSLNARKSFKHVFLRRSGVEESFAKLRGGAGQLSVSHDSVFPGEVSQTRPLSPLDTLATLERRQAKPSDSERRTDSTSHVVQRHRISLRVLEQIKTAIENRNQVASSTSSTETTSTHTTAERYQQETTENCLASGLGRFYEGERVKAVTRATSRDTVERSTVSPSSPKEELPLLESASLNHTAAHHRISVRPKNRRPPRRTNGQSNDATPSNIPSTISEGSDNLDSLEPVSGSSTSSPVESKNISIIRKSSSRLSTTSELYEELEAKLPRKPPSVLSLSPDSLDTSTASKTSDAPEQQQQQQEQQSELQIKPVARKLSNRISKGSDIFEELESKLPRRRSSSNSNRLSKSPDSLENTWFSKSTEGFDKLDEEEKVQIPVARKLLSPISKSIDRVSKLSDSLETIDNVNSDDSIERRRSSFEFRPRRPAKAISKSSESFEVLEQIRSTSSILPDIAELRKRSSTSELNLSRGRRHCKLMSKSTENFEKVESIETESQKEESTRPSSDLGKNYCRSSKRAMISSESSDNLEMDDELENRRMRKPPKRIPSTSVVDIVPTENVQEDGEASAMKRSPLPRLQKSSESSELGSTDTLDSEKKNKSDSTETLDSLEKDLEQDRKEEEMTDSVVEKREKDDAWSDSKMITTSTTATADSANIEATKDAKPLISDKSYWRQSSDTKENIDIHQLLASITIVTRMADNGNQRGSVIFPKKKFSSPPTSPVKQQEDNKLLFNNLLASKNDEDLQNMLNGNISEVSTDTKSFKEKLIMFEKLGK